MGNCLVTKLKESVNNPNLPILGITIDLDSYPGVSNPNNGSIMRTYSVQSSIPGVFYLESNIQYALIPATDFRGKRMRVVSNDINNTMCGLLTSSNLVDGQIAPFCGSLDDSWFDQGASDAEPGKVYDFEIPQNCAYIYIYRYSNRTPASITVY